MTTYKGQDRMAPFLPMIRYSHDSYIFGSVLSKILPVFMYACLFCDITRQHMLFIFYSVIKIIPLVVLGEQDIHM